MFCFFFFQAEDGIRDLVRSRGLGDVYKRQLQVRVAAAEYAREKLLQTVVDAVKGILETGACLACLLYTSDAADERSSVDLGGRRIIKKKTREVTWRWRSTSNKLLVATSDDN